ncbi:uncharacterized protein LOC103317314 [Nasonia vitripennis]|uniref:Uncharacterized protein n=1 Tax=Nasonia vitripennis TaxID=7425 RepID=A0A7M7PZT4_NASVI|nr:uncharacterized protein LOC103317314 [Nasonia vitripennis]
MSKISCLLFLLNVFSCYSQQGTILTKVADRFRRHHNRYLDSFSDPRCDCQIPTNQHESDAIQPLFKKQPIWQNISFNLQFIYPAANENNLTSPTIRASIVQLVCGNDGNNLAFNSLPLTFISSAIVRCALLDNGTCTNRLFTPSNHYLLDFKSFSEITCTDKQVPEVHIPILPLPYYSCKLINITCLEIGFTVPWHISPLGFLPVLKSIAFDGAKLQPIVAHIFMPSSILHGQRDDGNHTFRRGSVFSSTRIDLKEVYQRDYQRKRLFDILGNQKLVDEYVPETGDSYLTEGQLISEQDLFYKVQKPSAFFYENTVPIWRSIATGNWELSGKFLRNLALDTGIGFLYYSGVIDTLELLDQEGNKKPIFLAQKQDGTYTNCR